MKNGMETAITIIITASVLIFASTTSQAASISLQVNPAVSAVGPGDSVSVDIFFDGADSRGSHPGDFSGDLLIDFDAAALRLNDIVPALPGIISPPEIARDRGPDSARFIFGDLQLPGDMGVIATLEFTALAFTGSTELTVNDGNALGSFVNGLDAFTPVFNGTSVASAVPVPAAMWLMLSALGSLSLLRRRARLT